jgi:hypothetical protein
VEWTVTGGLTRFRSGVLRLDLFPYGADAALDLMRRRAQTFVVLAALGYLLWDGPARANRSIADLARVNGVPCHPHPKQDTVAVAREDLPALFAGTHHWNIVCWDAPRVPAPSKLAAQAAVAEGIGRWWHQTAALHMLEGAHVCLWSHDNACFSFEARQPEPVRLLFAGALADAVATAVERASGRSVDVAPAPDRLVEHIWDAAPAFELRIEPRPEKPYRVRVLFGQGRAWPAPPPRVADPFVPIGHADYDLPTGRWVHRYRSSATRGAPPGRPRPTRAP